MNHNPEIDNEELIDLGEALAETHGNFGLIQPDAPQNRVSLGILAD